MKKMLRLALLPLLIAITFYLLLRGQNPQKIVDTIRGLSINYLLLAFLAMLLYLLLEALMINALTNLEKPVTTLSKSLQYMFVGQFYSLITPFASGGQPMQLLMMMRDGVKPSLATAVLVNKFLYFQVGVTLYSIVLFLFNWQNLVTYFIATKGLIAIGITFNAVGLFLIIASIYNSFMIKGLVRTIAALMRKFNVSESRVSHFEVRWIKEIDDFANSTQMLLVHKDIILKLTVMTLLQLTAFFGITYFVYRAFGQIDKGFVEVVALQSILYMSISLIPAPGSAGVAEGGFYMIFQSLFPIGTVTSAILVWRGITYYLNLLFSGVVTVSATAYRTIKS